MTRRFPLLIAAAALAVLASGCAGSGSKAKPSSGPRVWQPASADTLGPVLAIVGGHRITRHDVDSLLAPAAPPVREQYRDPAMFHELVERLVEQEALYQAAVRANTSADPDYRRELSIQERQLMMKHYYQNTVQNLPAIPDSAVHRYYEEHPSEFRIPGRARVRHIQLKTRAKAVQVLKQLRAGGRWDVLCSRNSLDKATAKNGGIVGFAVSDLDAVPGIGTAPSIVAAAFSLKEGETSEPLKSDKGWHLIRVDNVTQASVQAFSIVEKNVRSALENQRSEAFQTTLMDSLKKLSGVSIFEDSIKFAAHPAKSPADLFAEAQSAPSPSARIELFRQVEARYPQDKAAVQAAFMVGFTYAEEMSDFASARTAFQEFLKKYPTSDLAGSAKWMLENMQNSKPPPGVGSPDSMVIKTIPAPVGRPKGTNVKP